MKSLHSILFNLSRLPQSVRQLHATCCLKSYEGPGKTTVNILNSIQERLLIDQCRPDGFMFNDGSEVDTPIAVFPRTFFCWNIKSGQHINAASLSLFFALDPKPDLLILGLETAYDYQHVKNLRELVRKEGINVEILPVQQACAVYNYVNEEGRYVVGGFIPPREKDRLIFKRLKDARDTDEKSAVEKSKDESTKKPDLVESA